MYSALVNLLGSLEFIIRKSSGNAPIAISIFWHDAVDKETAHVVYPLLHGRVVDFDGFQVAILRVQHVGSKKKCSGPGGIVAVKRPVRWSNIRNTSTLHLRIVNVGYPFVIQFRNIENVTLACTFSRPVTEPALPFVTLRTVGWDASVIAPNAPESIFVNLIYQSI